MAPFDPKLVQAIRDAPDEAMTRVPTEYATVETKAYLAEHILKAATEGHRTYQGLVAAASARAYDRIS
jgi:hypothetical protein